MPDDQITVTLTREEGEWPEEIYRVQLDRLVNPAALHFGPEAGDVARVVQGWREAGAEVRRYIPAPETGEVEGWA